MNSKINKQESDSINYSNTPNLSQTQSIHTLKTEDKPIEVTKTTEAFETEAKPIDTTQPEQTNTTETGTEPAYLSQYSHIIQKLLEQGFPQDQIQNINLEVFQMIDNQ